MTADHCWRNIGELVQPQASPRAKSKPKETIGLSRSIYIAFREPSQLDLLHLHQDRKEHRYPKGHNHLRGLAIFNHRLGQAARRWVRQGQYSRFKYLVSNPMAAVQRRSRHPGNQQVLPAVLLPRLALTRVIPLVSFYRRHRRARVLS